MADATIRGISQVRECLFHSSENSIILTIILNIHVSVLGREWDEILCLIFALGKKIDLNTNRNLRSREGRKLRTENGEQRGRRRRRSQSLKGIRPEQCDHCPAPLIRLFTDLARSTGVAAAQTEHLKRAKVKQLPGRHTC